MDKFAGESSGLTLRGCVRRELCERTACSQSPGRYYGCREQQIRDLARAGCDDLALTFGPFWTFDDSP